MTSGSCCECGAAVEREQPAITEGPLAPLAARLRLFCTPCGDRAEAEVARRERERQDQERADDIRRRQRASGIPARLRELTWRDVEAGNRSDVLEAAKAWAAGGDEISGLVLSGDVGVGKTWLAAAAARARLEHGPLRWIFVPTLFACLKLPFEDDRHGDALRVLIGSQALVLDDLDKARPTENAAQQLLAAIDSRVTAGARLLITTNLELGAIAERFPQSGEAIASRLFEYCGGAAFVMEGHDRRTARLAS
jgi:DNA replication protein DnaC